MTRTRIKFCGVTRAADAELCAALGVDAVGLNFYPKSPRCVSVPVAAELVKALGPFVCSVGVVVDAPPFQMQSVAQYAGLRALQTYSENPPEFDFGPLGWLPAFRVKDEAGLEGVRCYLKSVQPPPPGRVLRTSTDLPHEGGGGATGLSSQVKGNQTATTSPLVGEVDVSRRRASGGGGFNSRVINPFAVVIDSFVPGEMGGTGHVAPWHLLAGLDLGVPLILAGGLTPDNVADAIRQVRPWGVDVASGIESSPGVKDAGRMRAFVQAVRDADGR